MKREERHGIEFFFNGTEIRWFHKWIAASLICSAVGAFLAHAFTVIPLLIGIVIVSIINFASWIIVLFHKK